jgi:hypothetical protein
MNGNQEREIENKYERFFFYHKYEQFRERNNEQIEKYEHAPRHLPGVAEYVHKQ